MTPKYTVNWGGWTVQVWTLLLGEWLYIASKPEHKQMRGTVEASNRVEAANKVLDLLKG